MTATAALSAARLRRERLLVLAALALIVALSWFYLASLATDAGAAAELVARARIAPWGALDFALAGAMWAVMMIAMMLPSAAPAILLYDLLLRRRRARGEASSALAPSAAFGAGYLLVWAGFSVAATALQWGLEQAALLSPLSARAGPPLGGALLVLAGLYQLTPLKRACLEHCRAPIEFLARRWRPGVAGAVVLGARHGAFCVGCCWALMALLFAFGVMNLAWVGALAGFVLVEKLVPHGALVGRLAGALLLGAGVVVMLRG